jgi:hypothetical protein
LTGSGRSRTLPPIMQRLSPQIVVCAALSALILSAALPGDVSQAQQSGGPEESREGVLILRNGNVIAGQITRSENRFIVAVEGGLVSVDLGDTELFCRTLEEAYTHKALVVGINDVHGHLELAGWCQRQGLLERAKGELAKASSLAPSHPMISVIERRIQMSATPSKSGQRVAATPVQQPISPEELDRTARDMPAGTMEAFVRSIQPLLVNRCGAARCHGPASKNDFHLLRPPPSSRPSRRITQRNLHATLKLIDREDPTQSPLLTAALRPHGPLEVSVFAGRRADQYGRVADWVHRVARQADKSDKTVQASFEKPIDEPSDYAEAAIFNASATDWSNGGSGSGDIRLQGFGLESEMSGSVWQPDATFGTPSIPHHPQVKRGAPPPSFAPIDPFDPEIFNRRFHPRASRGE